MTPHVVLIDADHAPVWRVGRAPDPWAWVDRQYAGHNRWDDADGEFRTVYAGDSLYACYVEVLAYARPDVNADGSGLLDDIDEDPADAATHPVPRAGRVPRSWIQGRMVATARLDGGYADVRASNTIAALRPMFAPLAVRLGYPDFDAAALKSAEPRELTQRVATHLYGLTSAHSSPLVDGVRFASRHGDELTMWAVFERPGDDPATSRIHRGQVRLVDVAETDLTAAMALHHLSWTSPPKPPQH